MCPLLSGTRTQVQMFAMSGVSVKKEITESMTDEHVEQTKFKSEGKYYLSVPIFTLVPYDSMSQGRTTINMLTLI